MFGKKQRLPPNRSDQTQLFEHSRRKPCDGSAQPFYAAIEHIEGFLYLCLLLFAASFAAQHFQMKTQHHKRLSGFVVQFPADAPTLFLLCFQKLPGKLGGVRSGRLEDVGFGRRSRRHSSPQGYLEAITLRCADEGNRSWGTALEAEI